MQCWETVFSILLDCCIKSSAHCKLLQTPLRSVKSVESVMGGGEGMPVSVNIWGSRFKDKISDYKSRFIYVIFVLCYSERAYIWKRWAKL